LNIITITTVYKGQSTEPVKVDITDKWTLNIEVPKLTTDSSIFVLFCFFR